MENIFVRFNSDSLGKTLVGLDKELNSLNDLQLIFLCKDKCQEKYAELKNTWQLLTLLCSNGTIGCGDVSFLAEALWCIRRKDLVKKYLVVAVDRYERYLQSKSPRISQYRLMLHDLCENMVQGTFDKLKLRLYLIVPQADIEQVREPQEMFDLMEKYRLLGPSHEHDMIEMVEQSGDNDIYEVLAKYGRVKPRHSQAHVYNPGLAPRPNLPHQPYQPGFMYGDNPRQEMYTPGVEHPYNQLGRQPIPCSMQNGGGPLVSKVASNHQWGIPVTENHSAVRPRDTGVEHANRSVQDMLIETRSKPLQSYKMTSEPRGYCIIINNINFDRSSEHPDRAKKLRKREGGERDLELLKTTWENLHFDVQVYTDRTAEEMVDILIRMGCHVNHSDHDAFVCCVLTHGANNRVFGSDGLPVEVKDLTNPVKPHSCSSLKGKPKLFFVQACQGRDRQMGYPSGEIQTDCASTFYVPSDEMSDVPNEADILVSYATVPGFVSFRSRSDGSFYVTALCECLKEYADRNDLLSILTEVNRRVADKTADLEDGVFKQVPQPQTTLRKAVYFNVTR